MGRTSSFPSLSSRSSSNASEHRDHESLLLLSEKSLEKRVIRLRALLGHSLYRRLARWIVASLVLMAFFLFKGTTSLSASDNGLDLVPFSKPQLSPPALSPSGFLPETGVRGNGQTALVDQDQGPEAEDDMEMEDDLPTEDEDYREPHEDDDLMKQMPWLAFKHLDGYFHGLKTLVNKAKHVPEYPNTARDAPFPPPPLNRRVPKPRPYNPYASSGIHTCYLDEGNTVPAPAMYAYDGLPQHMPDPVLGSYELLGVRNDVCFDRFGRYGPYGLGYSKQRGGVGVGSDTESSGSAEVWAKTGQINYNAVDWGDAQQRCLAANKGRFWEPQSESKELPMVEHRDKGKKGRMAVVVRCYQGFRWTELAILNLRAMVTELSLKSGGEYTVHLLLHVHDADEPIWADDMTVQRLLDDSVPAEFHSLVTLWSEPQMKLFYPGDFGETLENNGGTSLHGVYRSAHMPLQVFAMQHPEYEHVWNWEMDMRCLGNYYELFDRIGRWADSQPRPLLWERSARYYVPAYHGTWDNFTAKVQLDVERSNERPIFGPVAFEGRRPLRSEERGESVLPKNCDANGDGAQCGVGEAADIITLNPIFDTDESGWVFADDVTGYQEQSSSDPPRRCAIVTASRLSKRLLAAMHEETWRHRHSMFSEMFPPTVALHHGLKAVYAPHPTYFDRAWKPIGAAADAAFNSGQYDSASGKNSPFDLDNEHNHKGTSWYYHSEFAGLLWRRWLGYSQLDGRGESGGRGGQGTERGGKAEESMEESSGRLCLRSMLVHPIKHEHPSEEPDKR